MTEKVYETQLGKIHYWINKDAENTDRQLVFLPGLTADHRLFEKQIAFFERKYPVFVWDAPGHASSWPFDLSFSLMEKAKWLNEILEENGFDQPAPLQKKYMTGIEIWLLKRMEPVYRHYPWKTLLKQGTEGVATSEYGRALMLDFMMTYDNDQKRYAALAGGGYRMLAEAVEADLPYEIKCPAMLICGTKDHAGSCIRYNKAWHKQTGIPLHWIEGAGHNSNTDKPEEINRLIDEFLHLADN